MIGQKKATKEKAARSLRRANYARCPARLASAGRSPNSPGAHHAPRAQAKVSRRLPAWLGARLAPTGFENQNPLNFDMLNPTYEPINVTETTACTMRRPTNTWPGILAIKASAPLFEKSFDKFSLTLLLQHPGFPFSNNLPSFFRIFGHAASPFLRKLSPPVIYSRIQSVSSIPLILPMYAFDNT